MAIQDEPTSFNDIYNSFLGKITDDLYAGSENGIGEWTREETEADLKNILLQSIPGFEFPRFPLYGYDEYAEEFESALTPEEINILALLMYNTWL